MNKKGNFGFMLAFFILVAILLVVSFFLVLGSAAINMVMDEVVPEVEGIGVLPDTSTNFTEYSGYTLTPLNTVIQSFTWMAGVAYVIAIIGLFGLAIGFRTTMSRWYIGIFIAFAFLIILMSIFMSNMYEDFYNDNDDYASILREHTLLSYMILHSPVIFTIVIFTSGIILFSGLQEEQFV